MRLPEKEYYFLSDLADKDEWDCKVDDLLHYGEIGLLEICVYIDTGKYVVYRTGQEAQNTEKEYFPGDALQRQLQRLLFIWPQDREEEYFPGDSCPILLKSEGWRNMRRLGHLQGDIVIIKHPQEDAFISPVKRDYAISDLFVTYEEKLRFEKECAPIKTQMGTTERENLLRLIGAFIEIHYQGNDYRKNDSSPNATAISKKFNGWLINNDFSDKGMTEGKFRKLIPDAYDLIMENKKKNPKPKIKLKKILPS
jgi:hypothetical protein